MITLHHCPQTRSMRTLWLLNELGVPFDVRCYPFDRNLRSAAFLSMSPAGRVPAIEISGMSMFETGAITEYLCERFSPDGLGRAPGSVDRADWLVWVHFSETLSQHTAALTQQHVALYEDAMRSPIVMKLEAARIGKCYDAIEARLSRPNGDCEYMLSSGFSAADVSVGQAVYMALHFERFGARPKLARWYERITNRAGFKASLPNKGEGIYDKAFYPPWPLEQAS